VANKVTKSAQLLDYLINDLHYSRNKAKSLLSYKAVTVNNRVIHRYDYELKVDDLIEINKAPTKINGGLSIDIIYEDHDLIVINKPTGLLSIATEKERELTAYQEVREYLENKNYSEKLFIVHRLDKETSGILVFAKNEELRNALRDNWNELVSKRGYYAIVDGIVKQEQIHVENYLKENSEGVVYSVKESDKWSKKAISDFKVIKRNKQYSLLDVSISTGRKNQIRVTLSDLGFPVLGDDKYGHKNRNIKRLYLHAYELSFTNPLTDKEYHFVSKMPQSFYNIA